MMRGRKRDGLSVACRRAVPSPVWPRGPGRGQDLRPVFDPQKKENSMPTESPNPSPQSPESITPEVMVAQLRAMREHSPEYTQLAITDARAIRRVAHVNPELVQAAINSLGASAGGESLLGVTAAEVQH